MTNTSLICSLKYSLNPYISVFHFQMHVFTVIGIQKSLLLFQVHNILKNLSAHYTVIGERIGRREGKGGLWWYFSLKTSLV